MIAWIETKIQTKLVAMIKNRLSGIPAGYAEILADLKQRIARERMRIILKVNAAKAMANFPMTLPLPISGMVAQTFKGPGKNYYHNLLSYHLNLHCYRISSSEESVTRRIEERALISSLRHLALALAPLKSIPARLQQMREPFSV